MTQTVKKVDHQNQVNNSAPKTQTQAPVPVKKDYYAFEAARQARKGFIVQNPDEVTTAAKFDAFFEHAMQETRRGDLVLEYSRLSTTERSWLAKALANRGVLDKSKKEESRKQNLHVDETKREAMLSSMTQELGMTQGIPEQNKEATGEIYQQAAKMMTAVQVSDADDQTHSKRDSYYDLKLVNRAFKLLEVARGRASDSDKKAVEDPKMTDLSKIATTGGYEGEKLVDFHKKATLKEKAAAAEVKDITSFTNFYRSLRREESKNLKEFDALNDREKKLFVWALANPSSVVKHVGFLRHSARHSNEARQKAKTEFASKTTIEISADQYKKAAMMLLSKDGRYFKAKFSYNQPIVRDAMHFVRAAEMMHVDQLRKKHEKMAENDDNLSGDTKWSATNAIDVKRGQMRVLADEVTTQQLFDAFLEEGLKRSGKQYEEVLNQYKELDDRQKALVIKGLSNRQSTEGRTDRSRLGWLQFLGNKLAGSSVIDQKKRDELIAEYEKNKRAAEASAGSGQKSIVIPGTDFKRAAINLISKDTQTLLGNRSWAIDVGMLQRGFALVKDAEKRMRKNEYENGYGKKALELRLKYAEANRQDAIKEKGYKAFSGATRQQVKDAGAVTSMNTFEAFFQSLMESDENTERWETFSGYSREQKILFVRALAHRDVVDRERDHAILTRYLRVWDLHGYKDRELRDKMKADYASNGADKTAGKETTIKEPENDEFTAAAYSIVSRESRRWNWGSKVAGAKVGDDRLIGRAMKLVEVADKKRDEAQDVKRNDFLSGQKDITGFEKDEIGQITKRATTEMKNLADSAKDLQSFSEFLAVAFSKSQMKKYTALKTEEKNLFAVVLAKRSLLDKKESDNSQDAQSTNTAGTDPKAQTPSDTTKKITGKVKSVAKGKDAQSAAAAEKRAKMQSVLQALEEKKALSLPTASAAEFRVAAYNLLSSKGRALGTHRFLWIKAGAVNSDLVDSAFKYVKERDQAIDRRNAKEAGREKVLLDYDIGELSSKANSDLRAQADAVWSADAFEKLLKERTATYGKEKYAIMYAHHGKKWREVFIAALASGGKEARKNKGYDDQRTSYRPSLSEHAAAYRLVAKKSETLAALHYAREMAEQAVQEGFESAKASDNNLTMDKYLEKQDGYKSIEMDDATEFEQEGLGWESIKTTWGVRKAMESGRNFAAWTKDTHEMHRSKVSSILQNMDNGSLKHKAAKFFLYTMNPFLWHMNTVSDESATATAAQIKDQGGFMKYLLDNATVDKRISLYNAVKTLSEENMNLLVQALQDRTILDDSLEKKDKDEIESQNEKGREELTQRFVSGTVKAPSEAEWAKAAGALVSRKLIGKSNGMDQREARSTVIDWELLQNALAYIKFEAQDQREMEQHAKKQGRSDAGKMRVGGGDLDLGMAMVAKEAFDVAKSGYALISSSDAVYDHNVHDEEYKYDTVIETISDLGNRKKEIEEALGVSSLSDVFSTEFIGGLFDADNLKSIMDRVQQSELIAVLQHAALRSMNLINGVKGLITGVVDLGVESAAMHKLRGASDSFDKQMMLGDKVDIVQASLQDAFGMAKELQTRNVTEKVFGLIDTVLGLASTTMQLAGVPLPIVMLFGSIKDFVFGATKFVVDRIIDLCSEDHVKKLLQTKERTHAYNQKVKAYNSKPGLPKGKKRNILTEGQVQKLLLRQSGLKTESGARAYICRKSANSMIYAYRGDRMSNEHLAAAQLFAGLRLPFKPGGNPPELKEIAAKLRGAK